jgi:peptide-methionine (S)-S-oxide reductase
MCTIMEGSPMSLFGSSKTRMVAAADALPGRSHAMEVADPHAVLGTSLNPPFPAGSERALFAMGCFWGAERKFWTLAGVHTTAVGYMAGITPNPTYDEVCSGRTGHTEAVLVVFDPNTIAYADLLRVFWESHNPTQGMRQGNDIGTQYRSGLYVTSSEQRDAAQASLARYQARLGLAGFGPITTEILDAPLFYYAETYHQQYLAKNPGGYCGLGGTGVTSA